MTWLLRALTLGLWKPKPDLKMRAIVEGKYEPVVGVAPGGFGEFHTFASTELEARRIAKRLSKTEGIKHADARPLNDEYYFINDKVLCTYDLRFCDCGLSFSTYWDDYDTLKCRKCKQEVECGESLPEKEVIKRVQQHEKARAA